MNTSFGTSLRGRSNRTENFLKALHISKRKSGKLDWQSSLLFFWQVSDDGLDTVVEGATGLFCPEQPAEALIETIERFEAPGVARFRRESGIVGG